jgi:hypothetical protein
MEYSNLVAFWCLIMSSLQGISAYYSLLDRYHAKQLSEGESLVSRKFTPLTISIILLLGTMATIAFGCWMFIAKPLRPTEKVTTVNAPCPTAVVSPHVLKHGPAATGNAKTTGDNSPANTGNGNTFSYGTPPPTDKSAPH